MGEHILALGSTLQTMKALIEGESRARVAAFLPQSKCKSAHLQAE